MKKIVIDLVREMLIGGFRKSNYEILKTKLAEPKRRLFQKQEDFLEAVRTATMMLSGWQSQIHSGKSPLPSTPEELEKFIDFRLADMSAIDALVLINKSYSSRSNKELVEEVRESIARFYTLGDEGVRKAHTYEYLLEQKLSEI